MESETEFTVRRSDLDLAGHVNNTTYVEWVIDAVPDVVWTTRALAELKISYISECHRGATIVSGSQHVQNAEGCKVLDRLVRRQDDVVVARARTAWRPVRSSAT